MSRALAYAILIVWSLVCLFPLAWVLSTAFKGAAEINSGPFYLPFLDFQPKRAISIPSSSRSLRPGWHS
jgi:multiple sugar transport system permease protein